MKPKKITVIVGSKNPIKINSVKMALSQYFQSCEIMTEGIDAPSLVADQPMTANETREGAVNRVVFCKQHHQANFYAAIEGGVENTSYGSFTFAYIVIDNGQYQSINRSASLPLPNSVYLALEAGEELGDVMDNLFNETNVKQKGGAIGLLTHQLATRGSTYEQAALLCMAPLVNESLYGK
ncbi:inosine/xanthosine triphosphatase [Shewanella sp. 202IG2-18]|uniref:inosine/xanthosine triphosphatase n=1 Tax=Parashewanella hymeniacidonis TaxID=2807618 RepID=UPI00196149B1|nr:inosine/xanthosine triphosphatase [Parashewanella hymeniacidonis]MBM7072318.1 inosine/xanthosine triphosphatase [Parashewanella hymeniacidonis]